MERNIKSVWINFWDENQRKEQVTPRGKGVFEMKGEILYYIVKKYNHELQKPLDLVYFKRFVISNSNQLSNIDGHLF